MAKPTESQKRPNPLDESPAATGEASGGARGPQTDRIRARAHEIWESEGRPDHRDNEHWLQAERELSTGGDTLEGDDLPNLDALREAAREHTDAIIVKSDLEDADQRESTPGVREQP